MDRRFPIVDFDARKFSGFFGKDADSLHAQLLDGGACNSNYLVRSSNGKFVCRIHNRGDPNREKFILEGVNGQIPSPEILWVGDGVSVMTYVEGQHFEPTAALVREAGRLIGRLSRMTLGRPGQFLPNGEIIDHDGWSSFKEGLRGLLNRSSVKKHLDEQTLSELADLLDRHGDILDSFDRGRNLVHGDFRPDNILASGNTITGVIDWEFAHSGCSYMDIGNFMRHLPEKWRNDFAFGLREEGFDLPEDWIFRASLMDLASQLEFLTSDLSNDFKRACVERIQRLVVAGVRRREDGCI